MSLSDVTDVPNLTKICTHPSAAEGAFHVLVASHKKTNWSSHYLWLAGLTNAKYYLYCREKTCEPLKTEQRLCNVNSIERLLLPNIGRDSAVFFDYALHVYDDPPDALAVLHGHVARSRHSTCSAVFGRLRSYYLGLLGEGSPHFQRIMISLNDRTWYGRRVPNVQAQGCSRRKMLRWTIRQQERRYGRQIDRECRSILQSWNISLLQTPYYHCCASFIFPGKRLWYYPRGFYRDMLNYHLSQRMDQLTSRTCFEFLIYRLFGDELDCGQTAKLNIFYQAADALYAHGEAGRKFVKYCEV
mmetsp:Transcript_1656/g.10167  ORF Transcript_1656/g.10167 Transcript_1656/m.10167 type:complete len:300 (+) Transcript_1656:421-1320(+)